ncbi:MAG TPA: PP2C family protein-serine/threonine phosphatase, partial [Pyrinomonadaceae bacterium]
AMFRTLVSIDLPLDKMLERASSVFCESTLPTHYATLVCGRLNPDGTVEISNAGHLPPLLLHDGRIQSIDATGLPVGMFGGEEFSVKRLRMEQGDTLFLYTDGLSEALNSAGSEYGRERLSACLISNHKLSASELIGTCITDSDEFRRIDHRADDLTVMAIQRVH